MIIMQSHKISTPTGATASYEKFKEISSNDNLSILNSDIRNYSGSPHKRCSALKDIIVFSHRSCQAIRKNPLHIGNSLKSLPGSFKTAFEMLHQHLKNVDLQPFDALISLALRGLAQHSIHICFPES